MANTDAAYGLRAVRHLNGSCLATNVYTIATGYATNLFRGDPVEGLADGSIQQAAAENVDNLGVFKGCEYVDANGNQVYRSYWPASTTATNIVAHVYDDPNIVFAVQSDATGVAAADVHNLADWEIVAGDTKTGQSAVNLDISAGMAGTGKAIRILRLVDDGENAWGAYSDVEVVFGEHALKGVVSGVGGV